VTVTVHGDGGFGQDRNVVALRANERTESAKRSETELPPSPAESLTIPLSERLRSPVSVTVTVSAGTVLSVPRFWRSSGNEASSDLGVPENPPEEKGIRRRAAASRETVRRGTPDGGQGRP
jgi:hypothetical protein